MSTGRAKTEGLSAATHTLIPIIASIASDEAPCSIYYTISHVVFAESCRHEKDRSRGKAPSILQ